MSNNISTIVEWSDSYDLGLPEIDSQHKTLFVMINDVWTAIAWRKSGEAIAAVLTRLEHYTIRHFTAEEALMRSIDYPGFEAHRRAHREFIERIAQERRNNAAGEAIGLKILHFLNNWLIDHIQTQDKAYAGHYERQRKPRSLLSRLFSSWGS